MSGQLAVAVAVEKFADCGPGKWWFVHHPDGFLIECALQQRAEQIAAEINAGRSPSPDLSLVQASVDRDAGHMPTCALTPRDDLTVGTHSSPEEGQRAAESPRFESVHGPREGHRPATYGQLVTAGETAPHSSPATSQGADGHPEPSSDALPAGPLKGDGNGKSERAVPHSNLAGRDSSNLDSAILTAPAEQSPAIAARQACPIQPKIQKVEEDRAATISQRERKPLKPHCLRPEMCGGYGRKHCGTCERAAGAQAA